MRLSVARVDDDFLPGAMGGALVGLAFGAVASARHGRHFSLGTVAELVNFDA
jgi:hypothetical protein